MKIKNTSRGLFFISVTITTTNSLHTQKKIRHTFFKGSFNELKVQSKIDKNKSKMLA